MRDLKRKITILHLGLLTSVPAFIIEHLNIIKKNIYLTIKKSKIKLSTLRNIYEVGGLKYTDIFYKTVSLQCSWVRQLFDKIFIHGK